MSERTMTDEELAASEARAAAATEGPWIAVLPRSQEGGPSICHAGPGWADEFSHPTNVRTAKGDALARRTWEQSAADAAFIAAARTDVPRLAAEVRRLRAVTDAARALAAQFKHAEHCPGNRHADCGPGENEAWCCVWCRAQEECLRRKADCDCHIAAWRELLGVPAAQEDGR
jgi:hypothetical protein